jgi:hypothetical protein
MRLAIYLCQDVIKLNRIEKIYKNGKEDHEVLPELDSDALKKVTSLNFQI